MFNLNKIDVNALVKEKAKSQEKIERLDIKFIELIKSFLIISNINKKIN